VYALTSRVTTFDDDLTPVVEEKETPDLLESPPLERVENGTPDFRSPRKRVDKMEKEGDAGLGG